MKNATFWTLLFVIFTSISIQAQWNFQKNENTPVCVSSNNQKNITVVSDTKKGAIIVWNDYRNGITNSDIYAQRITGAGYPKWTANGAPVCLSTTNQKDADAIEDGYGGVIVTWEDSRNGNSDIYAQRLDSLGLEKWTANGVVVVTKALTQNGIKIINDGAGGAFVVWQDSTSGINLIDIYAQHIDNLGNATWGAPGIAVCANAGNQINPRVVSDNAGGIIVAWQDKRNGSDYDIYAQRLNSSGVVQWLANGVAICSSIDTQSNCKLREDGSGGAIIAWIDNRNGVDASVFAQRINSSGIVQWTANGKAVCDATGSQSAIDITFNVASGMILTWKDERSGNANSDIYAQKVSLNGDMLWQTNGVLICSSIKDQLNPNIIGDGSGGAIITWQDYRNSLHFDIFAQKVNTSGVVQWDLNGLVVSSASANQVAAKNISDDSGGSIFVWEDYRNTTDYNIYVQRIYSDGTTDIKEFNNDLKQELSFPNPASNRLIIPVFTTSINLSCTIFDLSGRINTCESILKNNSMEVNTEKLSNGMYMYMITEDNQLVKQGKFTVINNE